MSIFSPIFNGLRKKKGGAVVDSSLDAATTEYLTALGIPNDSTVFYSGTAQQITGAGIWTAVDTFVKGLKTNNLWTKLKTVYPIIGGTAARHKFNLKNPLDTDAAFRLTFFGAWVHSATGAMPDGTTAYADTFFVPSARLATGSSSAGFYSRTTGAAAQSIYDIGAQDAPDTNSFGVIARYPNNTSYFMQGTSTFAVSATETDGAGWFLANRNSATLTQGWKRAVKVAETADGNTLPSNSIALAALKRNDGLFLYSFREHSFDYLGDGLTDADAANLYNLVQNLQTALNRQVS